MDLEVKTRSNLNRERNFGIKNYTDKSIDNKYKNIDNST